MLRLNNRTPFDAEITVRGTFRISNSSMPYTSVIAAPPSWTRWLLEWISILVHGPMNDAMTFVIPAWSESLATIRSDDYSSLTVGFSDVNTTWTRHLPGVYEWNSQALDLCISCKPGTASMKKSRRGPVVAGDIPLNIQMESSNETWEVLEAPITMIKYSPVFNNGYYESE